MVNGSYASGGMNSRYTSNTNEYVRVSGYAGGGVSFAFRDAVGNYFFCAVYPSSALYADAVAIRNTLHNGSWLYAGNSGASSNCTTLYIMSASYTWTDRLSP